MPAAHTMMELHVRGIALLGLLLLLAGDGASAKSIASYDQRQEGKVNVQIDVKDVSIVALVDSDMLEDYASYDYAYDYADFTIKPRPTTSAKPPALEEATSPAAGGAERPSNVSSAAANSTSGESIALVMSTAAPATTGADDAAGTTDSKIIEIVINPTKAAATEAPTTTTTTTAAAAPSSSRRRPAGIAEPRKKCPVGFLLKSGRCFKRRLSLISPRLAMMKLAPALLSRAKVLARNLVIEDS